MEYILVILAAFFAYMSSHCAEEQKQGRRIALPWERIKRKVFNKSDVKYRDGDNT